MRIRSRVAANASDPWNVIKTLFQTVCFWGFFLYVLPITIWSLEPYVSADKIRFQNDAAKPVAVIIFALAGSLGLISGVTMAVIGKGTPVPADCPSRLVIAGPYRYIRNPMAVAGILQGMAVGIYWGSLCIILYAFLGAPFWHWLVRPWEEQDLLQRFGDRYLHYRQNVKCWIPRVRPFSPT